MADFERLEPQTASVVLEYLRPAVLLHNDAHPARAWEIINKLAADCEKSVQVHERWKAAQMQLPFTS